MVLLDADGKPAHARAFMATSHSQYTHKEQDSDKWLRAPLTHNTFQTRLVHIVNPMVRNVTMRHCVLGLLGGPTSNSVIGLLMVHPTTS